MKKWISVTFVVTLMLLVSCSRSDLLLITENQTVPVESIQLSGPLLEISAEDNSFALTGNRFEGSPFYSNDDGPVFVKRLRSSDGRKYAGRTMPVRVKVEGYDTALHGRLAIFPATNPRKYGGRDLFLPERFNLTITVTAESLAQMDKEGTGFSCTSYYRSLQDWCDWALWISHSPIQE